MTIAQIRSIGLDPHNSRLNSRTAGNSKGRLVRSHLPRKSMVLFFKRADEVLRKHLTSVVAVTTRQRNVEANVGDSVKACAMNSRAPRTADRSAGPPRQTRTASGGVPSVAKASLATTPTPVERM